MAVYKDKKRKTWYIAYHYGNGKTLFKRNFATKEDARQAEHAIRSRGIVDPNKTLNDVFVEMTSNYRLNPSQRTLGEFKSIIKNHITPFFPDKKLSKYERRDIEVFQETLKNNGRSNYIINKAVSTINRAMNYAQRCGYLMVNPFINIQKLKHYKAPKEFLSYEEFMKGIKYVDNPMYRLFFELAFWNGFRRGELLAIQWKDIDFSNSLIRIHQHVIYPGTGTYEIVQGRKNNGGYYSEVDPDMLQHLKDYKEIASKEDYFTDDFFVFGGIRPLAPENPRRHLKRMLKKAQLKDVDLHSFRHSHVSYLYNYTGLTIQEIADRINDTTKVVLETYAHIFNNRKGKYGNAILLSKKAFNQTSRKD